VVTVKVPLKARTLLALAAVEVVPVVGIELTTGRINVADGHRYAWPKAAVTIEMLSLFGTERFDLPRITLEKPPVLL
jgi:hypothetical protein